MTEVQSDRDRHEKLVDPHLDRVGRLVDVWHRQTVLWVALANAAALLAVSNQIAQAPSAHGWLVPSAWLFLMGLITVGFGPRLLHRHFMTASAELFAFRSDPERELSPNANKLMKLADRCLMIGAGCFALGTILPLSGLTLLALGIRLCMSRGGV